MTDIQYIRQEVNKKGHTYAEVARRTNKDCRTVQKYADQEEFQPKMKRKKPQASTVMDPVKELVDQWLREDLKKKKKFRRIAKRIWQLLVEQEDFKGSDRTVRAYVSKRKRDLLEESDEVAIPLNPQPGDTQVDFGEAPFKMSGEIVDLPYLVLSFPYSNAFYIQVFESQNQDCFLEGLKRFFHHIGSVPRVIRFDNPSPAVKKVLPRGERDLTGMVRGAEISQHQENSHNHIKLTISNRGIQREIAAIANRTNISKYISAKTFRNTFVRLMIDKGYQWNIIQVLLGYHSTSTRSETYFRITINNIQDLIPNRPDL